MGPLAAARRIPVPPLVTTVAVIAARFMWVFPSLYLPRLLIPSVRRADPYPIWQRPFLVSFFGVRGIVSLAAALALPLVTATGMPFPHRDLILLLTFWIILITLVGQGLLLPPVLRWLGLGKVAEMMLGVAEAVPDVSFENAVTDLSVER